MSGNVVFVESMWIIKCLYRDLAMGDLIQALSLRSERYSMHLGHGVFFFKIYLFIYLFWWMAHLRDGTSLIHEYVYGLFCDRIGSRWFLYWMVWGLRYVVNARRCSLTLLGHHVIAHSFMPRSICAHSNCCQ